MPVQEASETSSFHPPIRESSTNPSTVPLPHPDQLKAALDSEMATYNKLLIIIEESKYISTLFNESDLAHGNARLVLDCALSQASESRTRQSALRMQLRLLPGRQRLERDTSGLRVAVERTLEAQNVSLRWEFMASAQLFDSVGHGARVVMRHVASLCERMIGLGARVGKVCLDVRGKFR